MGAPSVPNTNAAKAVQKSLEVSCTIEFGLELSKHFVQFPATQSIFVMTAGPVDLTVTFLSPVEVSIYGPYYLEKELILSIAYRPCQTVPSVLLSCPICGCKRRRVALCAGLHGHQC